MITNIINNPFRMLGVFSNATIKEITANKGKITAYSKVGKAVEFPADMVSIMPSLDRSLQNIEDATSSINLPLDKLKHSLFWFVNASSIDDVALKHLQAGNIEKALEIFNKRVSFSSLLNTGLCSVLNNNDETAIECFSILIHEEEHRNEFVKTICGETFSISEDELSKLFIDELLTTYDASKLVGLFPASGKDAEYLKALVIQKPIEKINSEITKAKNCGDSAVEEYNAGLLLIKNTKSALATLKKHLSSAELQYQTTVDALARQILQCGINYFNTSDDDETVDRALVLMEYAISIAVGKLLKDRCQENIDTVGSQSENYKIRNELQALVKLIEVSRNLQAKHEYIKHNSDEGHFSLRPDVNFIVQIKNILNKSKLELERISIKLGAKNEYYINYSDAIAAIVLNKLIEYINDSQKSYTPSCKDDYNKKIASAIDVMSLIGEFSLKRNTMINYVKNKSTLHEIYDQLNQNFFKRHEDKITYLLLNSTCKCN